MAVEAPQILMKDVWVPEEYKAWNPRTPLGFSVLKALGHLPMDLREELLDRIKSIVVVHSRLSLQVIRKDGFIEDYGVVSDKVVTTVGVNFIVDAFQNIVELENMKFHAIGTGSTAEAVGDTALVTELTTEYNPNSTRATGSTTENGANVYRTVGTNTLDGTPGAALREHGIFDNATVGSGVLLDRSVYGAITLSSGDSLQSTYDLTLTSGG